MKKVLRQSKRGFTLIEIVIAILIIAILAVVLFVAFSNQNEKAKETGVEVDLHTFYVAAKSAIITNEPDTLTTRANFVNKLNEFLDPQMQIKSDLKTSNENDPWGNAYRFFYYSEPNTETGGTDYWVAFTSQGVGIRLGWIFEPDSPSGVQKYSRDGIETYDNRYILILGYWAKPSVPEDDQERLIPLILGTGDPSLDDPYVRLSFFMEEDEEIELEDPEEMDDDTFIYFSNTLNDNGSGGGYTYSRNSSQGWVNRTINNYPGGNGYNSYRIRRSGGSDWSYLSWVRSTGGGSTPGAYYPTEGGVSDTGTISSDGDLSSALASQGIEVVDTNDDGEQTSVDLNVGKGNIIRLTFNDTDKIAEGVEWFKSGSTVTLRAIPAEDYNFVYWKIDGSIVSSSDTITRTVYSNTDFTAKFRMALSVVGGVLKTPSGKTLSQYIEESSGSGNSNVIDTQLTASNLAEIAEIDGSGAVSIPSTYVDGEGKTHRITSIADDAFKNNTTITSVDIPDTVTSIGNSAFEGCTNLSSVTGGESVQTIGEYAFKDCTSLNTADLPNSLNSLGRGAYSGCNSLSSSSYSGDGMTYYYSDTFTGTANPFTLNFPDGIRVIDPETGEEVIQYVEKANGTYTSENGLWTYNVSNNEATLTAYLGTSGEDVDLIVPNIIDGVKVVQLQSSFNGETFRKIEIQRNLAIGYEVFKNTTADDVIIGDNCVLGWVSMSINATNLYIGNL